VILHHVLGLQVFQTDLGFCETVWLTAYVESHNVHELVFMNLVTLMRACSGYFRFFDDVKEFVAI
jgi:hypothetical protein